MLISYLPLYASFLINWKSRIIFSWIFCQRNESCLFSVLHYRFNFSGNLSCAFLFSISVATSFCYIQCLIYIKLKIGGSRYIKLCGNWRPTRLSNETMTRKFTANIGLTSFRQLCVQIIFVFGQLIIPYMSAKLQVCKSACNIPRARSQFLGNKTSQFHF